MKLILSTALIMALAAPVAANPPLREVAEIDDSLMVLGIAHEISKTCKGISGRELKGLALAFRLNNRAQDLGYSKDEIEKYRKSKAEKKRMRAKASAYLEAQGVDAKKDQELCAFGRSEMKKKTAIGGLLR